MATEGQQQGLSRRDLIRRGAIGAGVVWATPMILQSAAGAGTACSPCPCATAYSVKWDTGIANLCTTVAGAPGSAGPRGIDPTCGNVPGGPGSYQQGGFSTLEVVSCIQGAGNAWGRVTVRLKCEGRFYGAGVKGANACTIIPGGECVREMTLELPSNLSHFVLYYCCC